MGSKTRLSSYCTKRANNGVNLVTSCKLDTRLARPILLKADVMCVQGMPSFRRAFVCFANFSGYAS